MPSFSIYCMKKGSLVTFKNFHNVKKIEDLGIILEIQETLVLKNSIGFEYEALCRIFWLLLQNKKRVPSFKVDNRNRKWYLKKNLYLVEEELKEKWLLSK